MSFADDLIAYQRNAWPAMVADLASTLGVTSRSLTALGIGWMPDGLCWVFPERDAEGKIVGLVKRFSDGKKFCVDGSKRGLTYALDPAFDPKGEKYVPGSQNWVRSSEDFPCPICGKGDWCLLSSENPADPRAVICGRVAEGSTQPLGDAGHLHIRKPSGQVRSTSPLQLSSLPVLIVEGQSDVAAAYDLGFAAVGKPSAAGGLIALGDLLVGREAVVLGENDAGAGRQGMEKTFETLKPKVKSIAKLMPPEGVKDLRAWLKTGLTAEQFRKVVLESADSTSASTLLESVAPLDIAERWLRERHWMVGLPILRQYAANWYRYDGTKYAKKDDKTFIRGDLYAFLKDKTCKRASGKGEINFVPYDADAHKISNVMDALTMFCPVYDDAPCWLDEEDHPRTQDTVLFTNGMLDLTTMKLTPATPRLFSLIAVPYEWTPKAKCVKWVRFLNEVFPNDPQKIDLLQEWFGYNLVADTSQEKLMFFVGRPGAGKGTVLEALRAVLGGTQVASTSFDTLVGDFGLQPLLGKLAAIMPDAHITRRGDPAKALQVLKEISGQDSVAVNRKNKEFLSDHKLTCRFTISVNSMPDLPDHERSLDRRLLLLHFGECFVGREDTTLKSRIVEEAPGIAVWALDGLRRLRAKGFTVPVSSLPVMEEFRRQSSPVSEFCDEHCLFDSHYEMPSVMLYDAFARWCKDQGALAGSQTRFSQRLFLLYPGCRAARIMFTGRQVRAFHGVKLTEEAVEKYLVGRR